MVELLRERYEALEVVGQGGEGRVLKALDRQHDRVVALKIREVTSDADREAVLTEARILLAIPPHAHLPLVRDDFFEGNQYVIAMDWIDGTDLGRVLQARGHPGLAPSTVLHWLADAAAALTHLHSQHPQVIHGDIKPANLILTRGGRVTLVDFGLSSAPDAPRHRGGTRGYAAPERVVNGQRSRATDIYSLAATAFALLTGSPPTGIRPSWEGIDPAQAAELEAAIRLGLATDPELRPDTAGELVELMRAGWGATLPTGVLTFCLTDIEGSTALWEAKPVEMAQALVVHDELVAAAVEGCGGRFLKSMGEGDATVSVFDSPGAAVNASLEVTRALGAVAWPEDLVLRARVGLHTGEAEQRGGDYFGTTLNVASRIRGLADGSQVFLSRATADLVAKHLPDSASLVDLGPTRLRGIAAPQNVYALAAPGVDTPRPGTECPYPGLLAFGPDDTELFFGRETVVAELIDRFERGGLLAVVGGSGSGKSSVLRAGLAADGRAAIITPGSDPMAALSGAAADTALVVDQFEELFTLCEDEDVRRAFVDAVLDRPAAVAIGLRADFYGSCAPYPALAAAVAANQVLLGPMTEDELRRAITQPAALAGLRLEPGLVDVLVSEVEGEPGALPLLSHALRATWEERDGRVLTLEAYRTTGGVRGAIAATADRAVDGLSVADRELARQLFLRLVEPGEGSQDTRRLARLDELTPADDDTVPVTRVLDAVATARLVTVHAGTVEVAHEALIREWPRLQGWLDEDRDGLRVQRHLTTAAAAWEALGRDPAELYRGPRLASALEWRDRGSHTSAQEAAFLEASEEEQQRLEQAQTRTNRRLRRLLSGAVVALVVALLAAGFAFVQSGNARTARDHADVARVAAVSRSLVDRQPDVGLLLAAEAFRRQDSADTRSTLLEGLETHPLLAGLLYGVQSGLEVAVFTPDGKLLITPTSDGSGILLWDTATRKRVGALVNERDNLLDAAISPDGRWLAAAAYWQDGEGFGSRLQVWDLPARTLYKAIDSDVGISSTTFSADSKTLITQNIPLNVQTTAVQIWDTATWTSSEPWALVDEYIGDDAVAVSGDGRLLAAQVPTGAIDVWSVPEHRLVHETPPTSDVRITALAFTSDGATLAVAEETGAINLVDPLTGAPHGAPLTVPDAAPSSIEFSPDGSKVAVATAQGRTHLFRLPDGQPLGPPLAANASSINDVSFSPDGNQLATAGLDRTGAIWRLDGLRTIGKPANDHTAVATEVHYTFDGSKLVTAGADGTVTIRDIASGTVRTLQIGGEVQTVALNQPGTMLAAGGTTGEVKTFDVATGAPGPVFTAVGGEWIQKVAFNPTTGLVAIGVESHPGRDPEPDEDGGYLLTWDPATGNEVGRRIVEKNTDFPYDAAWSADGTLLVTAGSNHVLHFYDGATHKRLGKDAVSEDAAFVSVAISPDGSRVATGTTSGIVRQWSTATHKQLGADLKGHTGWVTGVAYSPDGETLASTTTGFSTTRLWDVATGASIGGELTAGRHPFTDRTFIVEHFQGSRPAFSPDGRQLATPSFDGTTVVWDLQPSHWLDAACAVVGRDLTRAEWKQYFNTRPYRRTCLGI